MSEHSAIPALPDSTVEFVGPFQSHEVVVHGWQVPWLTATPIPGGRVHLTLDNRMGVDLTLSEVERVVPFVADCIAVAMGYTGHPQPDCPEPQRRPPFTPMMKIDTRRDSGV